MSTTVVIITASLVDFKHCESTVRIKFSRGTDRNAVPPPVFGVPPPEIAVPLLKVVIPPPGSIFMAHTVFLVS